MNEPPDGIYMTIKCPLKSILKNHDIIKPIIERTVCEMNQHVSIGYQFIKLYLLDKFKNDEEFPTVNLQFVLDALKTISSSKQKQRKNVVNKNMKDDMKLLYDDIFSKLMNTIPSIKNKKFIINESAKEMLTCITTNISTHFVKHLFKYINCIHRDEQAAVIKTEKNNDIRKKLYNKLNSDVKSLKTALINNDIKIADKQYHDWFKKNRSFLFPEKIKNSVAYDVKVKPERYIYYSFYINREIEKIGKRPYQVIPQRNNIIPKHITLNTSGIIEIIDDKKQNIFSYNKTEILSNCKKHQKHVWSNILKLEKRSIFNHDKYIFYNQLSTDGISCSLLFIKKELKDKKFGQRIPPPKKIINEYQKLEDLSKKECKKYLDEDKYKHVSLDPGKIRPISMIDDENNFYKYSSHRLRNDNFTNKSNIILTQLKLENPHVVEKETELSKFSSRTLNSNKYKKFVAKKNQVNSDIEDFYKNSVLRKNKFRSFVRRKQCESTLIKEINEKYIGDSEKKLIIFHGDWSRETQMKGCIPSPTTGFKKLLSKNFKIIDVNEYNTSKLYNKTFGQLENVTKEGKKLHEVLTPKEKTKQYIYVNRDVNASKNILMLAKIFLKKQKRPKEFSRPIIKKDQKVGSTKNHQVHKVATACVRLSKPT